MSNNLDDFERGLAFSRQMRAAAEFFRATSVAAPWLYNLPEELNELAARLQLSPETVTQMIDAGKIPLRRRRRRGRKLCVLIHDALAAVASFNNCSVEEQ